MAERFETDGARWSVVDARRVSLAGVEQNGRREFEELLNRFHHLLVLLAFHSRMFALVIGEQHAPSKANDQRQCHGGNQQDPAEQIVLLGRTDL